MAGKSSYVPKGTDSDVVVNDEVDEQRVDAGEFENTPVVRHFYKELPFLAIHKLLYCM